MLLAGARGAKPLGDEGQGVEFPEGASLLGRAGPNPSRPPETRGAWAQGRAKTIRPAPHAGREAVSGGGPVAVGSLRKVMTVALGVRRQSRSGAPRGKKER